MALRPDRDESGNPAQTSFRAVRRCRVVDHCGYVMQLEDSTRLVLIPHPHGAIQLPRNLAHFFHGDSDVWNGRVSDVTLQSRSVWEFQNHRRGVCDTVKLERLALAEPTELLPSTARFPAALAGGIGG